MGVNIYFLPAIFDLVFGRGIFDCYRFKDQGGDDAKMYTR